MFSVRSQVSHVLIVRIYRFLYGLKAADVVASVVDDASNHVTIRLTISFYYEYILWLILLIHLYILLQVWF
jgi:hypothetical protein